MNLSRGNIMKHMPKILRVIRVAFCIVSAAFILFAVGIVNNVFKYIYARWNLDLIEHNLDSNLPVEYLIIILVWNYIIGFFIIGLTWKYFGIPRVTVIGKLYKRYMDSYYEEDED